MIDTTLTGPETLAGRYLRRFWHPVLVADKLAAGRVVPLTIMGSHLALYRSEDGAVHCVDNRCAHRGVMLSVGRVEGDMIRCPYHGWAYGPDGQCRHQPFESPAYARRIRIGGYPTREYLGLIFLYLGEEDPPEFPLYPELEGADAVISMVEEIPCNWFQHVENQVDGHVWITHAPTPPAGTGAVTSLPKISATPTEWGVCIASTLPDDSPKLFQFGMPSTGLFAIYPKDIPGQDAKGGRFDRSWQLFLGFRTPIDDVRHLQFSVVAVFADPDQVAAARAVWDRFIAGSPSAYAAARKVLDGTLAYDDLAAHCDFLPLAQDLVVLCAQGTTADRSRGVEHLGASDLGVVLVRRLYQEELTAMAEGKSLRTFRRPPGLLPVPEGRLDRARQG